MRLFSIILRSNFVLVPVHDGRVDLEREAGSLAILDAHHREFEGIREPAEIVVASRIDAVDADAHRHRTGGLQLERQVVRNERTVGTEHRAETLARSVCNEVHNIGTGHRLATAENHDLEPRLRDFVNELKGFCRREFGRLVLARVLVAVLAGQVTLVGGHPRYNHHKPRSKRTTR